MTDSRVKEHVLPFDAAVKLLKSMKKRQFFFSVSIDAITAVDATRRYSLAACIPVSRATLLERLDNIYNSALKQNALVSISDHGRCVFIGG